MRSILRTLPVALSGVLLLTACGSQQAGSRQDGRAPAGASGAPGSAGAFSCDSRSSAAATAPAGSASAGSAPDKDGVRVLGIGRGTRPCFAFEVTNKEKEPFDYTIAFTLLSDAGAALETTKETVLSVKPGETARRTAELRGLSAVAPNSGRVRVAKVRSVPTAEAPSQGGTCPSSGLHFYADDDANTAMGLRALAVNLRNCGTRPYRLNGYPQLQVLDEGHRPVSGVETVRGSEVAQSTGADGEPRPLVLQPGEGAYAVLVWRNTTQSGEPVNAPYARVRVQSGAAPVMVIPEFDLGTTGKLGVGPWKKEEPRAPGTAGTSGTISQTP
ncbi:DUF4232 domain-containing protein [Streptomyces sp. URMC 127]|uniref:DUF4232 domain-containing protein n=1 Tax=Streptomyces sp. URMC 127 TaxID=3423402 RepID=UPI003F1E1E82